MASSEVVGRRVLALLRRGAATAAGSSSWRALVIGIPTALLAWFAIRCVLAKTGGAPAAPLDDAYIHFQFARSFAEGNPLVYSPGYGPVGGATSVLWPALLAVPYALGVTGHSLVWAAWALGFVALGLLAAEARQATLRLAGPGSAAGAAVLVLAFGANAWFAASGMEVVPLAWLMLRSVRRAAEWCEGDADADAAGLCTRRRELVLLACLSPLMRPEGAWASLLIAITLAFAPRGRHRALALLPLAGLALPGLVNLALTGDFASTTARSKWLPMSPYATPATLLDAITSYLETLVTTLLDGELWSALFLPQGSAPFALASLAALPIAGFRRGCRARGLLLAALALGIAFPGSYDCPLCNRLRYLWPFFPAWLVGAAALCDLLGEALRRHLSALRGVTYLALGAAAGALLERLPHALDDLGTSAAAIYDQQVSLGVWAQRALPPTARIGVNDTGAITYFSGRSTFDVVGLTTSGEARYWAAGPGSRFEHYERLGRARLPTHYIVYPEWFALAELLGARLEERYVPGASILGGQRMVAYVADHARLGSAERPTASTLQTRDLVDRLDVADLESEAEHGYQLFAAGQVWNALYASGERLDGGRSERRQERFLLELATGGALVLRVAAQTETVLDIRIGEVELFVRIPTSSWHEAELELPPGLASGKQLISIRSRAGPFSSLHYFSLGPLR